MPTQLLRLSALILLAFIAARTYAQDTLVIPYQGMASYYADRFHGHRTSSGERYDKRNFTCANRHFPLGTLLRVTHLANNLSVEVRVNDCGPHRPSRIVDLSRAAAAEIGLIRDGVAEVRVELISLGSGEMPCGNKYPRPVIMPAPTNDSPAITPPVSPPATPPAQPETPRSTPLPETPAQPSTPPSRPLPTPPTQPATPETIPSSTSTSTSTGFGVQVGSYGVMENAERMQATLSSKGITNTFIARRGELFRVMVGPFPEREAAEQTRQQLQQTHSISSVVIDLSAQR